MTTREQALTFLRGLKLGNYGATMTITRTSWTTCLRRSTNRRRARRRY